MLGSPGLLILQSVVEGLGPGPGLLSLDTLRGPGHDAAHLALHGPLVPPRPARLTLVLHQGVVRHAHPGPE